MAPSLRRGCVVGAGVGGSGQSTSVAIQGAWGPGAASFPLCPRLHYFIPFSLIPRALRSTQHTDLTKEGADYIELVFGPLRKPGQVPLLYKNVMY